MLTATPIPTAAEWHDVLRQFPTAHPLQTAVWGEFKSRWGWQAQPWLFSDGQARPVAAGLILRRPLLGSRLPMLYLPKGPIVSPELAEEAGGITAVLTTLEQIARQQGAVFLKIDPDIAHGRGETPEPIPHGQAWLSQFAQRGWHFSPEQIQFRNSVFLDLTPDEETILGNMKQKTRYNIRYAARKGVTVRLGTAVDWPLIYQMYAETGARDGFLLRPRDYYMDGWQSLHNVGMAQALIAEYEGEPLGAVIVVHFHQTALYMYGASSEKERNLMPNYLLQWEAIRWAKAQGCTQYDFWGAPDSFTEDDRLWGVWRFKAGFNGEVRHHLGAWDFAPRPWLYRFFTEALPRYRQWRRGMSKA
jgi:peptidoglycan pentaglycine glycine transferase (the first glycine)